MGRRGGERRPQRERSVARAQMLVAVAEPIAERASSREGKKAFRISAAAGRKMRLGPRVWALRVAQDSLKAGAPRTIEVSARLAPGRWRSQRRFGFAWILVVRAVRLLLPPRPGLRLRRGPGRWG